MYECIPSRKMSNSTWRSGLPRYAMRSEFQQQIMEFNTLYAGTLPPPPPRLIRQNADVPIYWEELVAMEEGRTPIKVVAEPVAPFAPLKVQFNSLFNALASVKVVLEYESDEDMYV